MVICDFRSLTTTAATGANFSEKCQQDHHHRGERLLFNSSTVTCAELVTKRHRSMYIREDIGR